VVEQERREKREERREKRDTTLHCSALHSHVMRFGQVILGAAGAGKTTYCRGAQHFLELQGRDCLVVNLDPANDTYEYECALDVRDLVCARQVEEEYKLGPNGALVFCMEYLEKNVDWLQEGLLEIHKQQHAKEDEKKEKVEEEDGGGDGGSSSGGLQLDESDLYVVLDCPGQVELFATHGSFRRILSVLEKELGFRFACVHCVDVQLCSDANNYMAAIMLSLNVMLNLELPHVNVLTKCDMMKRLGHFEMPFDYYLDAQNLQHLLISGDDNKKQQQGGGSSRTLDPKFYRLTEGLCELLEDFALVNFIPVAIEDGRSLNRLVKMIDKCLGYVPSIPATSTQGPMSASEERQAFIESLDQATSVDALGSMDWQEHFLNFDLSKKTTANDSLHSK